MAGIHVKFGISEEKFLANLSRAAYQVALEHGLKDPFIDVELDMQKALKKAIQEDMWASAICGTTPVCTKAARLKPFSKEAESLFK